MTKEVKSEHYSLQDLDESDNSLVADSIYGNIGIETT